jgi:hypothetical protein
VVVDILGTWLVTKASPAVGLSNVGGRRSISDWSLGQELAWSFMNGKNIFIKDNVSGYVDVSDGEIQSFKPLVHIAIA